MKRLIIDSRTGKQKYIDIGNTLPDDIIQADKKLKDQEQVIYNIQESVKTKLINLGFTEDECKHIIH